MTWIPSDEDRKKVKTMAGVGISHRDIAKVMGCCANTLRKRCYEELEVGSIEANGKVAAALFRQATGDGRGAVTAAIFWLKCRAGWRQEDDGFVGALEETTRQQLIEWGVVEDGPDLREAEYEVQSNGSNGNAKGHALAEGDAEDASP